MPGVIKELETSRKVETDLLSQMELRALRRALDVKTSGLAGVDIIRERSIVERSKDKNYHALGFILPLVIALPV